MKKIIKSICIIVGVLFIATPFATPLIKSYLPQKTVLTYNSKPTTHNKVIPPSTYITKTQQYIDQAQHITDTKQTAQALQKALDTVNEGIILYSNNAQLYGLRGKIYTLLIGDVDDAALFAMNSYEQAYKIDPTNTAYIKDAITIAKQYATSNQLVSLLNNITQYDIENTEILLDLAQTQTKIGQLESAIATYTKLLTLLSQKNIASDVLATITTERDSLVKLVANQLADQPKTDQLLLDSSPSIGGPSENVRIPDEVVLGQTTANQYNTMTNDAASGESVLTAGTKNVTVETIQVVTTSKVYVTPIEDTNSVLYVKSKGNGSFTVAVDKTPEKNIVFKWLVTN